MTVWLRIISFIFQILTNKSKVRFPTTVHFKAQGVLKWHLGAWLPESATIRWNESVQQTGTVYRYTLWMIGCAKNARRDTPIDSPINKVGVWELSVYQFCWSANRLEYLAARISRSRSFKVCTCTQFRFAAHFHQRMVADSGSHVPRCHLRTSCA